MPIPKEILSVERPKNTIVYAYGKNKDKTAPSQLDVLQKLGLIDTSPSPKRKPGRPPKNCV